MDVHSSENRRIAKNTFYLYLRMFILLVVGLYTSRIILNTLGVTDYGIYNVVGGIVTMFVFVNYAMTNSTQRYITFELGKGDIKNLNRTFCTSLNIHILISICIVLLTETVGLWFLYHKMTIPVERFNAAFWVYQFSIVSCVINVMMVPYNALIIAYERMSAFAYISLFDSFLKLVIIVLVMLISSDKLIMFGALVLCTTVIDATIYLAYCYIKLPCSSFSLVYDKPLMIDMTKFASWSLIGNLSYVCSTQGLNILLNMYFNPAVNAARGVAVQVQTAIANFSYSIENAIKPQITKTYAQNDMDRMFKLMMISSRLSFFVLLFMVIPVFIEAPHILKIWLNVVPDHSVPFLRITLLFLLSESLTGSLLTAIQAKGDLKKYQLYVSLFSLSIVPASYIVLENCFCPEAVFWITLAVSIMVQFVKLQIAYEMIGISRNIFIKDVFLRTILVALFSSILVLPAYLFLSPSFLRIIILSIISSVMISISIWFVGFTNEEKVFVLAKLQPYLKKVRL